jgi:acetyl-CoA C-acetyltransferase
MLGHDLIKAGTATVVVAGGMESMTNAPHLLNGSRTGIRYGTTEFLDHMAHDGLTNPYDGKAMGVFGDMACAKYSYDRAALDAFSAESVHRAKAAQSSGAFDAEIVPVTVKGRKGEVVVDKDEEPDKVDVAKIPGLRAAFGKDGVLTAASSSKISDGAAATVLMSADEGIQARPEAARTHRRPRGPRAGSRVVHDGADPCHPQRAGQGRMDGGGRGPVRDQRSLRVRGDGADDRARRPA